MSADTIRTRYTLQVTLDPTRPAQSQALAEALAKLQRLDDFEVIKSEQVRRSPIRLDKLRLYGTGK